MRGFIKTQNVTKRSSLNRHFQAAERILFSLAVIFGGLAMLYALYLAIVFGPIFNVDKVIVAGELNHVSKEQIKTLAGVGSGQKLFGVNVHQMHLNLKKHPWIKQASVRRRLPDTVWIYIEEYKPEVILINNTKPYYVDAQGEVFKQVEAVESKALEVISGLHGQDKLQQGLEVIDLYKQTKLGQAWGIAELHYESPYGYYIITERGPIDIYLGNRFSTAKFKILDNYSGVIKRKGEKISYLYANDENRIAVGYEKIKIF